MTGGPDAPVLADGVPIGAPDPHAETTRQETGR